MIGGHRPPAGWSLDETAYNTALLRATEASTSVQTPAAAGPQQRALVQQAVRTGIITHQDTPLPLEQYGHTMPCAARCTAVHPPWYYQ